MMTRISLVAFTLCIFFLNSLAQADVRLPAVLGSKMVLQRNKPIQLWGWAEPQEEVEVTFAGKKQNTTADQDGRWHVKFPAMKADGKTHSIVFQGKNRIELNDVLIGDVWVGSGQSNMEWPMTRTMGAKEAIAAADHPNIRLFHIPKVKKDKPVDDVNAVWKTCAPDTIPNFSAVLYYFGRKLQAEVDVPIGLINSSWGGSPIEPWTVTDESSGAMYNGMIAPITNFSIRGVTWYQGETNVLQKNGLAYRDKMEALIQGWRNVWSDRELPFYFVQIAPWSGRYEPGQLPALWEAQVATLKIPGTGMAVTTDLVDNIADIHPQNKLDVGERLALWALYKSYRTIDSGYSGPLFRQQTIEGDQIRLQFAHVEGGFKSRDGKALSEFQIAGEDGNYVDAVAEIQGKSVVVSADSLKEPRSVRMGWHKTSNPNLVNSIGLPASPFQSRDWTGGTGIEAQSKKRETKKKTAPKKAEQIKPLVANLKYSEHDACVLDFWKADGDGPRPLLVYIHGGGWIGGDKKRTAKQIEPYLREGISYAAINYRLTGEAPLPAPVHDAARAIQFIKSKALEWNINPDRIALTGGSAGACTSMWILLHDDLANPEASDPVERESTRVCAAAVAGGQTSIDPKVIEGWLGPKVLEHAMINKAVGEETIQGALANYQKHEALYKEFSPYNHVDGDDPPLMMSYGNNMKLPSESAGHGIHHPVYGIKLKEKSDSVGHECHLLIKDVSESDKYQSAEQFLKANLLAK